MSSEIYFEKPAAADEKHERIIRDVYEKCTETYDEDLAVGVCVTGNEGIRKINREFRNVDSATDVLSFPLLDAKDGEISWDGKDLDRKTGSVMIGDIVISIERAGEQAGELGHGIERELAFLTCHGMLHLLGYDHETPEREKTMTQKQKEILDGLGYRRGD